MFKFTLLGTGIGYPTPDRQPTSAFVSVHGDRYLLDTPDGVQTLLQEYNVGMKIDSILISSIDITNLLGLPGLLDRLSMIAEGNEQPEIASPSIYVPVSGEESRDQVVDRVKEFTSVTERSHSATICPVAEDEIIRETENYTIKTFLTKASYPSVGYRIFESDRPGKFDRERAEALGVPVGEKFGQLQRGDSVELQDGSIITPDQVVGDSRPGRSIAFTGATEYFDELSDLVRSTDVLVCSGGITSSDFNEDYPEDHMSAFQAGTIAEDADTSVLIITHISGRYGPQPYGLQPDLNQTFRGPFILARDGMSFGLLTREKHGRTKDKSDVISPVD